MELSNKCGVRGGAGAHCLAQYDNRPAWDLEQRRALNLAPRFSVDIRALGACVDLKSVVE
jgi:hypothetical protein